MRGFGRVGLVILAFFNPLITLPLLAYVGINIARRRVADGRRESDPTYEAPFERRQRVREERQRSRDMGRRMAQEYTWLRGWDPTMLPHDMKMNLCDPDAVRFDCAGISGLVRGEKHGADVRYTFPLRDESHADAMAQEVKASGGMASVFVDSDGKYKVSASNAALINELAKKAYPASVEEVDREVRTVRQWVVDGCSSYAEAEAKLKAMKDADLSLVPVRSFTSVTASVGGEVSEYSDGAPLGKDDIALPFGSFIVTEVESIRRSAKVTVPADVEDDRLADYVLDHFDGAKRDRSSETVVKDVRFEDGTPQMDARSLVDEDGTVLLVRDDPAAALSGLKASVYLDSVEEASAFLSGGVIPAGSFLVVDREGVSVPDGKIAVDVEMDGDLLSKVALQGEASPSLVSKMESLGVSQDRYKAAVLEQMASGPGCTVILEEAVDAVRAKISGVRIGEIGDRLANARLPQLKGEDMQRWLKDAAAIQAVSITVDAKRGELRVDTVVNNVHRAETRKLTDSEVMALSARGRISKAEMKDIVMQLHPDIFKTYSVGGKSLFVDPLDDYIRGRSPRTSAEVLKEKAALRKAEGEKKGKSAGPRIS